MKKQSVLKLRDVDKIEVLNTLYQAFVEYIKNARMAAERLTVGGCGLIFVIIGWLITIDNGRTQVIANAINSDDARVIIIIGILLIFFFLFTAIYELEKEFIGVAKVMKKINNAHCLHEKGIYLKRDTLFPEEWKEFGVGQWRESVFIIYRYAALFSTVFGVIAVLVLLR